MQPVPARVATHDDLFHADDVLVGAVLRVLNPTVEITRTRDSAMLANMPLVFDVGGVCDVHAGRLDHHLPNPPRRPDGAPLSSLGLAWPLLSPGLAEESGLREDRARALITALETQVVRVVDRVDCGEWDRALGPTPAWYGAVTSERPVWDEQPTDPAEARALFDIGYDRQTLVLSALLRKLVASVRTDDDAGMAVTGFLAQVERLGQPAKLRYLAARERAIPVMESLLHNHGAADTPLLLPRPALPWREALRALRSRGAGAPPPLSHVIFVGFDGLWSVVTVPAEGPGAVMASFPEPWRGRSGADLARVSCFPDAVFCHQGGHLAKFGSEASARAAAAAVARGQVTHGIQLPQRST